MRVRAYFPVPQNGVKTETFSPQNDRTMELNVNFLLAATVRNINVSMYAPCTLYACVQYTRDTQWYRNAGRTLRCIASIEN